MGVFTGTATVGLVGGYTNSSVVEYSASQLVNVSLPVIFTNGTGLNQANVYVGAALPVLTGATTTFDLYSGFEDAFGVLVTMTKLKGLILRNRSTTVGENLIIAGNFCSSSLGLSAHSMKPGSVLSFVDPTGFTVTNTTADTITIQNLNATTVIYDLVMWGVV